MPWVLVDWHDAVVKKSVIAIDNVVVRSFIRGRLRWKLAVLQREVLWRGLGLVGIHGGLE